MFKQTAEFMPVSELTFKVIYRNYFCGIFYSTIEDIYTY